MSDIDEDVVEASDEEGEMTSSQVLQELEEAWISERMSPTLERHRSDIVECLLDQIHQMTENLKKCKKRDIRISIHKMEIDRIRFVLSSYLRVRLEKIEKYAHYLIEQDESKDDAEKILSPRETVYAKEYVSNMESHFQKLVLDKMPENVRSFDGNKIAVKPNLDSYVFFRVNESVPGVILKDSISSERDEEVDLEKGSQYLMRYEAVKEFLDSGVIAFI